MHETRVLPPEHVDSMKAQVGNQLDGVTEKTPDVLEKLRTAIESGQCELMGSPYAHPMLPNFPEEDGWRSEIRRVRVSETYSDLFTTAAGLTDQLTPLIDSAKALLDNLNDNVLSEANVAQISALLENANTAVQDADNLVNNVNQQMQVRNQRLTKKQMIRNVQIYQA